MLKAAIILERAEIGLGGAERSVAELVTELRHQGVAATILAAKGSPDERVQILCDVYPGKRVPLGVFEAALREHLQSHSYDIVHSTLPLMTADVYQPRGGSYQAAMLYNAASYTCRCQRFLKRSTHWLNRKRTQYLAAEKRLCRSHPEIMIAALSRFTASHFQTYYDMPTERIAVVPNGINNSVEPDADKAAALRGQILQSISIPDGKLPFLFLFAANNPRLKGIEPLLEALKRLDDATMSDAYPVLVTAGSKPFGTSAANVVQLGSLDRITEALSVCDAAVLPTWYDPCSRFILEALSAGKPVITTRFNGAAERYEDGRHGVVLARPDDVSGLSAAMRRFCDRGEIDLAHQAIVQDNLKSTVSIGGHVTALIELYERILANKENH